MCHRPSSFSGPVSGPAVLVPYLHSAHPSRRCLIGTDVTSPRGQAVLGRIWPSDGKVLAGCKRRLYEMFEQGRIRAVIDPVPFSGLESIPDAIDHMLSGRSTGKVVVKIAKDMP